MTLGASSTALVAALPALDLSTDPQFVEEVKRLATEARNAKKDDPTTCARIEELLINRFAEKIEGLGLHDEIISDCIWTTRRGIDSFLRGTLPANKLCSYIVKAVNFKIGLKLSDEDFQSEIVELIPVDQLSFQGHEQTVARMMLHEPCECNEQEQSELGGIFDSTENRILNHAIIFEAIGKLDKRIIDIWLFCDENSVELTAQKYSLSQLEVRTIIASGRKQIRDHVKKALAD
ncbi:MAG: hypothetical protein WCO23_04330 [bacterium]